MEQEKRGLILRQQSEISTIRANQINDISQHAAIIGDLRLSIREAIDSPSFNQLIASGANLKETRQVLAVLISKYANMLTVGGNLRPEHPMQYAEAIIHDNPTMSLDDFNILLSNGVKGRYNEAGKLFRFDISVIYEWIRAYQEQFWEVKEQQPKQKSPLEYLSSERLTELQEVILKADGIKPVIPITEKEIKEEGQLRPKKAKYVGTDREYLIEKELRRRWANEVFDKYTGKPLPNYLSFDEWIML